MVDVQSVQEDILAYLTSHHVPPMQQWLQNILPTLKLNTHIAGLQKTVLFRILASDLTTTVQATLQSSFPDDISDPSTKQLCIRGPVVIQVLDIEDISCSRWSQVEAMEMDERGEATKGREIIRVVPNDEDATDQNPPRSSRDRPAGPHKLLVQDARGQRGFAVELERIPQISTNMPIGVKLLLQNVLAARGLLLLTPSNTDYLGGKVEAWDRTWREGRKQVLKANAGNVDVLV